MIKFNVSGWLWMLAALAAVFAPIAGCGEGGLEGYANDWATAITREIWVRENEEHLQTKADLIKTERYEENLKLCLEEGRAWMRRKYGFNSRWTMQMYSKFFYEKFFQFYPELEPYRI